MKYHLEKQHKTLNLLNLRRSGLYRRAPHLDSTCWGKEKHMKDCFDERPLSTEFSFSRFLIPMLNQYEGWALFMDCDMFFRSDPAELFRIVQKEKIRTRLFERKALWCVKHQDQPTEKTKTTICFVQELSIYLQYYVSSPRLGKYTRNIITFIIIIIR